MHRNTVGGIPKEGGPGEERPRNHPLRLQAEEMCRREEEEEEEGDKDEVGAK